jgi:hypothetical protein
MSSWQAPTPRPRDGLPAVDLDARVKRGRATAQPNRTPRGKRVRLAAHGLGPVDVEGPVDLTIYGPLDPYPARHHAEVTPKHYQVIVEATRGQGDAAHDGTVEFVFETIRADRPGRYVAIFRRTDVSSRAAARCAFVLT